MNKLTIVGIALSAIGAMSILIYFIGQLHKAAKEERQKKQSAPMKDEHLRML